LRRINPHWSLGLRLGRETRCCWWAGGSPARGMGAHTTVTAVRVASRIWTPAPRGTCHNRMMGLQPRKRVLVGVGDGGCEVMIGYVDGLVQGGWATAPAANAGLQARFWLGGPRSGGCLRAFWAQVLWVVVVSVCSAALQMLHPLEFVHVHSRWATGQPILWGVCSWGTGRNPCWLVRHRHGGAYECRHSSNKSVEVSLDPLTLEYRGNPRISSLVRIVVVDLHILFWRCCFATRRYQVGCR
jgi:hypothetical protein